MVEYGMYYTLYCVSSTGPEAFPLPDKYSREDAALEQAKDVARVLGCTVEVWYSGEKDARHTVSPT